jgi:hypothetical protein
MKKATKALRSKKYRQTRNNPDFTDDYMTQIMLFEAPTVRVFQSLVLKIIEIIRKRYRQNNFEFSNSIFFEKLVKQVAAATTIQMSFRAYLRKKLEAHKPLLVDRLIVKRAIY